MPSNQRLDPLGIYGTRSAARLQTARRRRRLQQNLIGLAALAAVGAAVMWLRSPRIPAGGLAWWRELPLEAAGPPVLTDSGELLVPSRSGQVRLVGIGQPAEDAPGMDAGTVVFNSAFPMQAAPLVRDAKAYLPSLDGTLYAIDWRTRKLLWKVGTAAAQTTAPVELTLPANGVMPARKLIVCGNDDGSVFAVEAGTGRRVWGRNAGGPVGGALAVAVLEFPNGQRIPHVLVPVGAGVATRGGVVCLDARNGQPRWRFPKDGRAFAVATTPPALDVDEVGVTRRIFLATDDGVVYALDAITGRYVFGKASRPGLWKSFVKPLTERRSDTLISLRGAPAYFPEAGAVVVGGNDGGLRALDAATGKVRWTFDCGEPIRDRPRLLRLHGRPVILTGSEAPELWAIDAETGRATNRWKLAGDSGAIWADVAPSGENVLVLDGDARLQSISLPQAQTGPAQ